MPAQEVVAGQLVLHLDPAQSGLAAVVDVCRRAATVAVAQMAVQAEQGAADAHVERHADHRLQRRDVHAVRVQAQVGFHRLRFHAAADVVVALAELAGQRQLQRPVHVVGQALDAVMPDMHGQRHRLVSGKIPVVDIAVFDLQLGQTPVPAWRCSRRWLGLVPGHGTAGRHLARCRRPHQRGQIEAAVALALHIQLQAARDEAVQAGLAVGQVEPGNLQFQ